MKKWMIPFSIIIVLLLVIGMGTVLYGLYQAHSDTDISSGMRGDTPGPVNQVIAQPYALDAAVSPETVQGWLDLLHAADDGSPIFSKGIANLEHLLVSMPPEQTRLLPNYPNPFNPETWIPYQLAQPAEVTMSIYAADGKLVRTLRLGHQAAGKYQSKTRAVHWDGRNDLGEHVASGIYFYTFQADNFHATGKMLIMK